MTQTETLAAAADLLDVAGIAHYTQMLPSKDVLIAYSPTDGSDVVKAMAARGVAVRVAPQGTPNLYTVAVLTG